MQNALKHMDRTAANVKKIILKWINTLILFQEEIAQKIQVHAGKL